MFIGKFRETSFFAWNEECILLRIELCTSKLLFDLIIGQSSEEIPMNQEYNIKRIVPRL